MTVSGLVNYFGHRHVTTAFIAQYSSYWNGPTLDDLINVYSEAQERNGKLHKALTRSTVGYIIDLSGRHAIYSLSLKVL